MTRSTWRGSIPWALGILLAAVGAPAGAADGEGSRAAAVEIRAARDQSNAAIRQHELDQIVGWLGEDAGLRTSSGRFYAGRDAQRRAYAEQFERFPDVVYIRTPETVTIGRSGQEASERGTWVGRWTADGGPVEVTGEYMAMWRRVDDAWRIHAELFVRLDCRGTGCASAAEGTPR